MIIIVGAIKMKSFFIISLLISGCAYGAPTKEIEVDKLNKKDLNNPWQIAERLAIKPNSPDWLIEDSIKASEAWCSATKVWCPEVFIGEKELTGDYKIHVAVVKDKHNPDGYGGHISGGSKTIAVNPLAKGCITIILHELGHSAGLSHSRIGVMRDHVSDCSLDYVDEYILSEFCQLWECSND